MAKEIEEMSVSELMGELKKEGLKWTPSERHLMLTPEYITERLSAISKKFDAACEDRGIDLVEGHFVYKRTYFSVVIEDGPYLLRESCDPTYSQELRDWLLIKNGLASPNWVL